MSALIALRWDGAMGCTAPARVSDAEYLCRYAREVRAYVTQFDPHRPHLESGKKVLRELRRAWIAGDDDAGSYGRRYPREHRVLKTMHPGVSW